MARRLTGLLSPRSLRVRAVLVVLAVILAPLLWVWMSGVTDTTWGAKLRWDVNEVSERARSAYVSGDLHTLEQAAWWRAVRIRVVRDDGVVELDVDRSGASWLPLPLFSFFFGPSGTPDLATADALRPAVHHRPEFREGLDAGELVGCRLTRDSTLLVCTKVTKLDDHTALYVQKGMARAVRSLYEVRFQLLALSLNAVILGGLLGLWLGWRLVQPVHALQDQVRARMRPPLSTEPITLDRSDEFGDLAQAFNDLLAALAARNRSNEAFAADIAHELKNPVAAVRAATEALQRGVPDEQRQQRLVRIFSESAARMDQVVSRFLELARAEAGLGDRTRETIDLGALVHGIADTLRADERHAQRKKLTVRGAPVPVVAAPERLETALRNLLDNALHFAESEVRVTVHHLGESAVLEVRDDGPGIPEQDLSQVFDRYFSRRDGGTGLGLALAKAIVEAHGGSLVAASSAEGAVFTLTLPSPSEPQ